MTEYNNLVKLYSCCAKPMCCAEFQLDTLSKFVYVKDDYGNTAKVPFNEMYTLSKQFIEFYNSKGIV